MSDHSRPPRGRGPRQRSSKPAEHRTPPPPVITLDPADYVPTGFRDLGVPEAVDFGLAAAGFTAPFAIQTKAIPVALTGRDVCGRA